MHLYDVIVVRNLQNPMPVSDAYIVWWASGIVARLPIAMPEQTYQFIWRCANCSSHFANIARVDGIIKQEKKCPKCKSVNQLTLTNKEIMIRCKLYDPATQGYTEEMIENHHYQELGM